MIEAINRPAISGLAAEDPALEMRDKLMLFGQFVGDWHILEARFPKAGICVHAIFNRMTWLDEFTQSKRPKKRNT